MMNLERYRKQMLFREFGEQGQIRLRHSSALLVGCGALGTVIADSLTRAGIGKLRIADRDFVDLSNLQRQVLFNEDDVANHEPKAVVAARKLKAINAEVEIEPHVADVNHENILGLCEDVDLILDGTDNFETRFLINDASLETGIPWISGGVLGASGQVMTFAPGKTGCLRCLIDSVPPQTETCDTAGVLGPAVNIIASLQVIRALQLIRDPDQPDRRMTIVDLWDGSFQQVDLTSLSQQNGCNACGKGERIWLQGKQGSQTTVLCGRNAVQITPPEKKQIDFEHLAQSLQSSGEINRNPFLFWFKPSGKPEIEIHLFQDGRAIIKGTEDMAEAKTLYARYLGS